MNNPQRILDVEQAEYITYDQAKIIYNLGKTTLIQLVNNSGAGRKIGKSVRINKKVLSEYIENQFKEVSNNVYINQ